MIRDQSSVLLCRKNYQSNPNRLAPVLKITSIKTGYLNKIHKYYNDIVLESPEPKTLCANHR